MDVENTSPAPETGAETQATPSEQPWYSSTEALKPLERFQSPEEFTKALVPGEEATPEEWGAFYNGLGRPETPAEYDLTLDIPDDLKSFAPSENEMGQWAEAFHEAGITQAQAKRLMENVPKILEDGRGEFQAAQEQYSKAQMDYLSQYYGDETKAQAAITEVESVIDNVLVKKFPDVAEALKADKNYYVNSIATPLIQYIGKLVKPQEILPGVPATQSVATKEPTIDYKKLTSRGEIVPDFNFFKR